MSEINNEGIMYPPGQEPEKIKKRMDTLFSKLDEAYPDKMIVGLHKDHKKWGETVTQLYRLLGYSNGNAFLEAYGYTVKRGASGRPSGKHMDVINELKRRYPNGPVCTTVKELKEANPDLAPKFKNLNNQSEKFFGMKFAKYLIQEGILVGTIEDPEKDAEVFAGLKERCSTPFHGSLIELQQAFLDIDWNAINRHYKHSKPEKSFKEFLINNGILVNEEDLAKDTLGKIIEELKNRYPEDEKFQGSLKDLLSQNSDLPISGLSYYIMKSFKMSTKEYLVDQGIMVPEKTDEERLAEATEILTKRYTASGESAYSVAQIKVENPDLSFITNIGKWTKKLFDQTATQYLVAKNIIIPFECDEKNKLIKYTDTGDSSVIVPNSVKSIGNNSFKGILRLSSVSIPEGVTEIGAYAFCNCKNLTSIILPDSLVSIKGMAFSNCISLTSIIIPASVKNISLSAFSGCTKLCDITVLGNDIELCHKVQFCILYMTIESAKDKVTEKEEKAWMNDYIHRLLSDNEWDTNSGDEKNRADYFETNPVIDFIDKSFVFTGFSYDKYNWAIVQKVIDLGGLKKKSVTGKTDYLVVNPLEAGEKKLEDALKQQKAGTPIKIIHKDDLIKCMKKEHAKKHAEIKI